MAQHTLTATDIRKIMDDTMHLDLTNEEKFEVIKQFEEEKGLNKGNRLFKKVMRDILLLGLGGNYDIKKIEAKMQEIEYSIEHLILEARESNDR
jgi:hypothetical protein|tara:strand:+ start:810 stop:1091 length:282 start_codon:yes stop_codon:yes gene_type:complete